jgi:DNA modification methylase
LEERAKVFNGQSDKPAGNAAGSVEDKFSTQPAKNFHPTVKPTQLMRYLIKLVTPEGGVVLDPFTGSGSTGKAALLDGYQFIGAELTEEYLPIIEGRLRWASEQEGEEDDTLF